MSRGFFLAIAGNIGVGKTELTNRLSAELGWLAYYEPVIENPYLDVFYADMKRWSFHLQIYFLSERFKAQAEIGRSELPFIQDRTIYEDAEIFARTLHAQGSMTDVDYHNYTALFDIMVGFLRKPDEGDISQNVQFFTIARLFSVDLAACGDTSVVKIVSAAPKRKGSGNRPEPSE